MDGLSYTLRSSRPQIVSDNRYHAVIEAEYGHEDKTLDFKIDSHHCRGCGRVGNQYLVQSKGHDRRDGLHYNGRDSYPVYLLYDSHIRPEPPENKLHLMVDPLVKIDVHPHAGQLPCHSGYGCPADTHSGKSQQSENQNRVENYINNSSRPLCNHGINCFSGSLQYPFQHNLLQHAH